MKNLKFALNSGKNRKLPYYLKNIFSYFLVPQGLYEKKRASLLEECKKRDDFEYIKDRVDYYCKLASIRKIGDNNPTLADFKRKDHKSVYFFDSYNVIKYFPKHYRWRFLFGDIRTLQPEPTFVKSRPLDCDNSNSILLNMNKVRHFIFLNDKKKFSEKRDMAIFRGGVYGNPQRTLFMEKHFGSDIVDAGEIIRRNRKSYSEHKEWHTQQVSLYDHLDYKFILSIEGNDVASNLKWIMSSNSIAVMSRPTCETWFMEGRLIPNVHYIEVKPDFSDLRERLEYYMAHPDEAEKIIENAHKYVEQFKNPKREKLISLLVADKYFRMTGME